MKVVTIERDHAIRFAAYAYPPPWSIYDGTPEAYAAFLEPANRYFSVVDGPELVGYCCFGAEARVAGGPYDELEPAVVDVGAGMDPDRVGQGLGPSFIACALAFAEATDRPRALRATVAAFNERSLRALARLGFTVADRFERASDGLRFEVLTVRAGEWSQPPRNRPP